MITLYGVYRSRAFRPIWLATEMGLNFTHVPVIQSYRLPNPHAADAPLNTVSPAFLAVNPLGQIPAFQEADLVLTESFAITNHLARVYGGPSGIGPASPAEAAEVDNWTLFAISAIETPALEILQIQDMGGDAKAGASIN